ncbi:transmembrane protein 106B-like isoform X2 [Apostichopus japonicus]
MHPSENDDPESRLPSQTNPTEKSNLHRESPPPNYSSTKSTTNGSTSSSSVPYTYQELPGSVVCPTCNGAGRIPRGQEEDLVALIPYTDDRLRPRRTKLYVCLSIVFCGLVAGVLCAFLLTKPVYMSIHNITTNRIQLNKTVPIIILDLEITYNISNSNFPAIYLNNMTVIGTQSFNPQPVVSNASVIDIKVRGRSSNQFAVNVTAIFTDQFIPDYCTPHMSRLITVEFVSSLQYSLMTQTSSVSSTEYRRVVCSENEIPNIG